MPRTVTINIVDDSGLAAVLPGASVRISERFTTGDTLAYAAVAGVPIAATFDSATGLLTLTGTATIAQYKQALQSITFRATRYGGGLLDVIGVTRTLSVYVTDDTGVSNTLPGVVAVTVFR